jgi:cell division protein FtsA
MKHGIITALDIGSSFVRSIIAKVGADKRLEILGIGEAESRGIEKGIVTDIQALADTIKTSLTEAETVAGCDAVNIFVNITGEHIKTHLGDGRISIPTLGPNEPGEISSEHVDQVINDAKTASRFRRDSSAPRFYTGSLKVRDRWAGRHP